MIAQIETDKVRGLQFHMDHVRTHLGACTAEVYVGRTLCANPDTPL